MNNMTENSTYQGAEIMQGDTTPNLPVQKQFPARQLTPSLKEKDLTQQITMYGSLVIGPLGMLFNIVSLIIFVKLKFQKSPTGLHLLLFTVSETLMIVGVFMSRPRSWSQLIDIPIIARYHSAYCNILQFILSSQIVWSSLLLVSATIQRFIAVTFPLKVKSWNLEKWTQIIIFILTMISLGLGIIGGIGRTVDKRRIPYKCKEDPKYPELHFVSITVTYTILGYGACPILVLIFTCLIAKNLHIQYVMRKNMVTELDNQSTKEFKITIMLFITSCVFLIPRMFQVIVWYVRTYTNYVQSPVILNSLANFFITVSHSINFVVYFSFFDNFRKVFISWFSCGTEITQPETRLSSQITHSSQDVSAQNRPENPDAENDSNAQASSHM